MNNATFKPFKGKDYPRCPDTGKVCFLLKDARTKKNWLEQKGRERLRIYQCQYCNYQHLTSSVEMYTKRKDSKKFKKYG